MNIFDKKSLVKIEGDDLKDAKLSSSDFIDVQVKKRAFINVLGARLAMKMLFSKKIQANNIYSLYTIHSVLGELDIADIYFEGIKIDVRVVFNQNEIFIPKSQFKYGLLPNLYLVLELKEDFSSADILGFFEPEDLDKNNQNDDYYFYDANNLRSYESLKGFLESYIVENNFSFDRGLADNIEDLFLPLTDSDISEEDKLFLFQQLAQNFSLREKMVEFENFEFISKAAVKCDSLVADSVLDIVAAQKIFNEEEISEELPVDMFEDISDDIQEEVLDDIESEEKSDDKSGLEFGVGLATGAVLGAGATALAATAAAGALAGPEIGLDGVDINISSPLEAREAEFNENDLSDLDDLFEDEAEDNVVDEQDIDSIEDNNESGDDVINEQSLNLIEDEKIIDEENIESVDESLEIIDEENIESIDETLEIIDEENLLTFDDDFEINLEETELENFAQDSNLEELETQDEELEALPLIEEVLESDIEPEPDFNNENNELEDSDVQDDELEELDIAPEFEPETDKDENIVSEEQEESDIFEESDIDEKLNEEQEELLVSELPDFELLSGDVDTTEEVIQDSSKEDINSINDIDLEAIENNTEDEQLQNTTDELLSQVDEFLKDIEDIDDLDDESKLIVNEIASNNSEDDLLKVLFKNDDDKIIDNVEGLNDLQEFEIPQSRISSNNMDELSTFSLGKKINLQNLAKNRKMVIAASLAVVVSLAVGGSIIKNHNSANLANNSAPASVSAPNQPNANSELDSLSENLGGDMGSEQQQGPDQSAQQSIPGESQQDYVNRDMGKAVSDAFSSEPVNANISKIAWEVPEDLAYNDSFRKYLQIAGKNLKLNLQNNLLLVSDMAYSNNVVLDLSINKDGSIGSVSFVVSSGSKQIDKVVLQSVKETLKYLKMPSDELRGGSANATLIINF